MVNYTDKLEPAAGYCNDRSLYDSNYRRIFTMNNNQDSVFGANMRNFSSSSTGPSLNCPRGNVDNYHYVVNSTGYSNELRYPAALITADESALAGSGLSSGLTTFNPKSFLRSGSYFWLLSPSYWPKGSGSYGFCLSGSGVLNNRSTGSQDGVRPAISLKSGITAVSGSGTATDPWIVPAP